MKLVMIGSGYVGLVSGACFADFGHTVICVDKDPAKIAALNAGQMPIYEPGLDHLVASGVAGGRLRFTTEITEAVGDADAVFIAVGTPSRRGDGHADMVFVHAAAREIAPQELWPRQPPIRHRAAIPTSWIELTIREGRNRQVRRMTAAVGFPTLRLVRWAVGDWTLDGLGVGEWRKL